MNKFEFDILQNIKVNNTYNQRFLSKKTGFSLGLVNKTIQSLVNTKYLNEDYTISNQGEFFLYNNRPQKAIILAAGYGMRMVPINTEMPKGLLVVKNETLIERLIKQLHQVGVYDIDVIVGYMKEKYEFLIDEYNVNLVFNKDYSTKNNLFSLAKSIQKIDNCYITPCDIYFRENPFSSYEGYSWYLMSNTNAYSSFYSINRKQECKVNSTQHDGNKMIGISYFHRMDAANLKKVVLDMIQYRENESKFWEESLKQINFTVFAKLFKEEDYHEIDTFEDWMNLDTDYSTLSSTAIQTITKAFCISAKDIKNIHILKKGLTNHSFQFSVDNELYVMRTPENDANDLVNRYNEKNNYQVLKNEEDVDQVIYIDEQKGHKISKWIEHDHICDIYNEEDVRKCMKLLKELHEKKYPSSFIFDIFEKINFYENKWSEDSYYRDYKQTKEKINSLKSFIDENVETRTLCHIDAVADNFLIGEDSIHLIDWEYAAIQDPHIDIALFALDAMYDKEQIDNLIDLYFENNCPQNIRLKIYAYISCCGLMWSNWAEYKRGQGIEFGEYSLKMYRYAKEYYKYAQGGN